MEECHSSKLSIVTAEGSLGGRIVWVKMSHGRFVGDGSSRHRYYINLLLLHFRWSANMLISDKQNLLAEWRLMPTIETFGISEAGLKTRLDVKNSPLFYFLVKTKC